MNRAEKKRLDARELIREVEESGAIEIRNGIFFLPDVCEKFRGRGKWILHVEKGKLVKRNKKQD